MARYPGAVWRPIDTQYLSGKPLTTYNRVNLHVTAGRGSCFGTFNRPNAASSHFFVYKTGEVEQFVDTSLRAEADYEGNDATISIETEGGWPNAVAESEPWTDEQVEALARLYAWAVTTHGVERRIATDSKLGASSRGLSWHRLGVDGNFPALPSPRAGRLQRGGGMHYSTSRGKVCPGSVKIEQVPTIYARALAILGDTGHVSKPVPPAPTPTPTPPAPARIAEDGNWGPATTRRLQEVLGVGVDGVISSQDATWRTRNPGLAGSWQWVPSRSARGSLTIAALQRRLDVHDDGKIGPATIRALQERYGTPRDGVVSSPSRVIIALQERLNAGTV